MRDQRRQPRSLAGVFIGDREHHGGGGYLLYIGVSTLRSTTASFAARLAPWLRVQGRAKVFNRVSGATFIVASALLAAVKRSNSVS